MEKIVNIVVSILCAHKKILCLRVRGWRQRKDALIQSMYTTYYDTGETIKFTAIVELPLLFRRPYSMRHNSF